MKAKRDLIETIQIAQGNLSYIEKTGKINGTLLTEIERVMEEYANQKSIHFGRWILKNANIRFPKEGLTWFRVPESKDVSTAELFEIFNEEN